MSQLAMITHYSLAAFVAILQLSTICIAQPPANSDGDNAAENSTVSELFLAQDADNPAVAEGAAVSEAFSSRDKNSDGKISEEEFLAGGGQEPAALKRDFRVFDANGDGHLGEPEFNSIPAFTTESQRVAIQDPVVALSRTKLKKLSDLWPDLDSDKDGQLTLNEFKGAAVDAVLQDAGGFHAWDRNGDGKVTLEEAASLIDITFGVRSQTGELLRTPSGFVVDWRMFRGMNPDETGTVGRDDYIKAMGSQEEANKWFVGINKSERFNVTEFLTSDHKTNPVNTFLGLDTDLNGQVSRAELDGLPHGGTPPGMNWLAGFDDDGNGEYSLSEFMLLPHLNLLATWHTARDADNNGVLVFDEFLPMPRPTLTALAAEYFHRLDVNKDQSLSLVEWPFQTSHPVAKFLALDTDGDDKLNEAEFVAEGSLPVDRLRRDFKVFDADNDGQMTQAEFLTIPHWVPLQYQTPISDPVVQLSKQSLSHWAEWDKDGDDFLSVDEFQAVLPGQQIRGLENSTYADWDMDHDGKVSHKDAQVFLDVAFGVREITGELLRSSDGRIVDWGFFLSLDPDGDGRVTREEYLRHMNTVPDAESWYLSVAKDGRDSFGIPEFVASNHQNDPVSLFLSIDTDLNAGLSPEELKSVPWGPPMKRWLSGFDNNGDGVYSLNEFLLIPYINLIGTWHGTTDTNQDGQLTGDEFHIANAPVFAALSAEYFRRLDVNRDEALSLNEWPFHTSHPAARFAAIDVDSDGELTEAEFIGEGSLPPERLKRDFKVFDADGNGQMTHSEFFTIPHWIPESQRLGIPDPIVRLSANSLVELTKLWKDWDTDGDGSLTSEEFKAASPGRRIHGLEMSGFSDWDGDKDQKVSQEDAGHVLDMAFGVQSQTGELLRSKTGSIIDWRTFLGLKPDVSGRVLSQAYIKSLGSLEKAVQWFPAINDLKDGSFGVTEFATSDHKVDPISTFLGLDADLNGLLSPAELNALPAWGPPGRNWLPGFDDDHDGSYSLAEFRLIPQVNLLASWESAQDSDNDGKLSSHEFHFMPTPSLGCLSMEYFRRLDSNSDGFLTLKEWPFLFDPAKVPTSVLIEQRDHNGDGKLSFEESNGSLKRTQPSDQVDVGQEAALARAEDAFRLADANNDGLLDRQELSANEGLEVIAPGSTARSRTVASNVAAPVSSFFGMEEYSLGTYLIIEVNILLVVGVAIYLYRKRGEKK